MLSNISAGKLICGVELGYELLTFLFKIAEIKSV